MQVASLTHGPGPFIIHPNILGFLEHSLRQPQKSSGNIRKDEGLASDSLPLPPETCKPKEQAPGKNLLFEGLVPWRQYKEQQHRVVMRLRQSIH